MFLPSPSLYRVYPAHLVVNSADHVLMPALPSFLVPFVDQVEDCPASERHRFIFRAFNKPAVKENIGDLFRERFRVLDTLLCLVVHSFPFAGIPPGAVVSSRAFQSARLRSVCRSPFPARRSSLHRPSVLRTTR